MSCIRKSQLEIQVDGCLNIKLLFLKNHRGVDVGRHLWRLLGVDPAKAGSTTAQGCEQLRLEYPQGWRLYNLLGQHNPVSDHRYNNMKNNSRSRHLYNFLTTFIQLLPIFPQPMRPWCCKHSANLSTTFIHLSHTTHRNCMADIT